MTNKDTHSKNLFKENRIPSDYTPPVVVGCNIKTPENMGSIIRLCDNIVCKEIIFITDEENIRLSKIKKTASSSYNKIKWGFCSYAKLKKKLPLDYSWIAIETAKNSKNIFKTSLPDKAVFFVGSEVAGIPAKILKQCCKIVHIPLYGANTSLNVSHALAVSLFEWQKRLVDL